MRDIIQVSLISSTTLARSLARLASTHSLSMIISSLCFQENKMLLYTELCTYHDTSNTFYTCTLFYFQSTRLVAFVIMHL